MTFSYIAGTPIYTVRLLINDSDAADHVFDDTEIETFLSLEEGDVYMAASKAAWAIAAKLAAVAHDVQVGNVRQMTHHRAREYRLLAEKLEQSAIHNPAWAIASKAWDGPQGFTGQDISINKILRREV